MDPLVSVVIPCHNGFPFLPEALASVARQQAGDLEIIVVDDGSTDGSPAWAEQQPGVTVLRQPCRGPSAARNAGIRAARGHFIALLDSDDWWPDYKLRLQLTWMALRPALQVVHGRVRWRPEPGSALPDLNWETPDARLPMINLGAGLYRRGVFDRAGPLDESLRFAEDVDFFLRVREKDLPLVVLRDVTLEYRIHPGGMTAGPAPTGLGMQDALMRSIRRRRAAGLTAPLAPWNSFDEFAAPTISVVIPVWNGERFLHQAIQSVLAQTMAPDEIIVADDGSTDGSLRIAAGFGDRVRLLPAAHQGVSATRNRGVNAARGSLIAFLDADDLWLDDKLERQLACFRDNPGADIVYGWVEQFDHASGVARLPQSGQFPSACLFRRGAWIRTGPFAESLRAGEFID
ncbi:MAG TPA: hypothetical protein DEH78_05090, partial [Solibacterales bacterium]|nr:hypothetical protein [Bryobacterales bacterium]